MIFNISSGAPSGESLTVTAPAGVTVSASKGNNVKTKVADVNGITTFKGLTAGIWTVSISDGTQSASQTIEITTGYLMTIGFFAATINVIYPEGSTCTCSDGVTTLTADDTTGSYTFTVPNAGTWTVTSTDGEYTQSEDVVITSSGQNNNVELSYIPPLYLVDGSADCTSNWTGDFTIDGTDTVNHGRPTVSNNNGVMTVVTTETNAETWGGSLKTSEMDMTDYRKLCANITETNASDEVGYLYLGIATAGADGYKLVTVDDSGVSKLLRTEAITAAGPVELDISGLGAGEYMVVIQVVAKRGHATTVSFDSIYLK